MHSESRIPCPFDPSHTIKKEELEAHVKKCTAYKKLQDLESKPYYQKNINAGLESTVQDVKYEKPTNEKNKQTKLSQMLKSLDEQTFVNFVSKIQSVHDALFSQNEINSVYNKTGWNKQIVDNTFNKSGQDKPIRFNAKHADQLLSMVDILLQNSCLSQSCDYFEFGCGSASLSCTIKQSIHAIDPNIREENLQQFVLVDRASIHNKNDALISTFNNKKYAQVDRLVVDISDLVFDYIPFKNSVDNVCVISKHLCGVATDLTLKCVTETRKNKIPVKGIFIALCCHHQCRYNSYCNHDFLHFFGISENDFELMRLLSSWAIVFSGETDLAHDFDQKYHGYNARDKALIGNQCKRILDMGRVDYLRKHNYNCRLVYYCDRKTTPENAMIIATPNKDEAQ
ncbi:hypothetical protein AKO1_014440 [Acrasis kona]|uniref:tRNA:m(4)X modification enzyme TRM13 n=1 Tax=Acrasis kona TaxID=1008807 RepID=A0AAW2Z1R1_9EUKA